MANVSIKFNNKDYILSCDDGQEESLKKLTEFLDKKYNELKEKLGSIGENKLLLITTIQLIDEYFDLKKRVGDQKNKLDNLSSKFNELKSSYLLQVLYSFRGLCLSRVHHSDIYDDKIKFKH